MGASLVTAPTESPVTLAQVKEHLRVEHTEHDDRIQLYLDAETAFAEDFMGRALAPQVWDYVIDAFPLTTDAIQFVTLPLPTVMSVDGVFYNDADLTEVEFDAASYIADIASQPARIGLASGASWPTTYEGLNAVRIRFTTGYSDGGSPPAAEVRADIKIALMLRVQADYEGGEQAKALRDAAEVYLRRHRVHLALA
jgi:uncharacterized phiE125 gp8 family phage protein